MLRGRRASDCRVSVAWRSLEPKPEIGVNDELWSNAPTGDAWHVGPASFAHRQFQEPVSPTPDDFACMHNVSQYFEDQSRHE